MNQLKQLLYDELQIFVVLEASTLSECITSSQLSGIKVG